MADISFDIEMSKAQIDDVARRIRRAIEKEAPVLAFALINEVGALPQVQKFVNFLKDKQFISEFGIDELDASTISADFDSVFNTLGTLPRHSLIRRGSNGDIIFNLISEDYLRLITQNLWAPTVESTSKKSAILVNAWDIYEYGVVGSDFSAGLIKDEYLYEVKTDVQRKFSRSGLSIMVEKKGTFFKFGTGNAPKIFAVRSSILKNVNNIEQGALKIINKFAQVGSV